MSIVRLIPAPIPAMRHRAELPSCELPLANNASAAISYVTSVFVSLRRSTPPAPVPGRPRHPADGHAPLPGIRPSRPRRTRRRPHPPHRRTSPTQRRPAPQPRLTPDPQQHGPRTGTTDHGQWKCRTVLTGPARSRESFAPAGELPQATPDGFRSSWPLSALGHRTARPAPRGRPRAARSSYRGATEPRRRPARLQPRPERP